MSPPTSLHERLGRLTWPPTHLQRVDLEKLAAAGNDHAVEMLAAANRGIFPTPVALSWYIDLIDGAPERVL